MRWIDLTKHTSGRPIRINVEQISSLETSEDDSCTKVWFSAGHPDGQEDVKETPDDIIWKIKTAEII